MEEPIIFGITYADNDVRVDYATDNGEYHTSLGMSKFSVGDDSKMVQDFLNAHKQPCQIRVYNMTINFSADFIHKRKIALEKLVEAHNSRFDD